MYKWIRKITTYVYQKSKKEVLPIIQAGSTPSSLSKEEFKAALENALCSEGSSGVIVFTLKDLIQEDKLSELISYYQELQRYGGLDSSH